MITFIFKIIFNLSFEGVENIPENGTFIIASNHRTYFDPVFLALKVKRRCAYMAKAELFEEKPLFACLIRTLGAFPVVRGKGDTAVIDQAVEKLTDRNLVIFPEGTRSKDGKVGRGKTGVALIAARAGVSVLPVGIAYEGKLSFRKKVVIRYGRPISAEQLKISDTPAPRELKQLKLTIMGAITEMVEKEL